MRPVERPSSPQTSFNAYRDAFPFLQSAWGSYCSYCERRLETHLAIEHIQPKDLNPLLSLKWENFLLACTNCNSCKSNFNVELNLYIWPDINNTLKAFSYQQGIVRPNSGTHPAYKLANELLLLVGLDKIPGKSEREPTNTDFRWKFRLETEEKAKDARQDLLRADSPELRKHIIREAVECGGFSIWFTVFQDDGDMCQRLIDAHPGTATNCFAIGRPIPRPHVMI